jgi:YlmC/YmxH family sporulation protein
MTFRELRDKQVVQIETGVCLGRVDDLEFDPETDSIQGFVLYGRPRLFGLLGRDDSLFIGMADIRRFGLDTLLVTTPLPERPEPARRWHWPWEK